MKIGFDFDGVIGDTNPLKPKIALKTFNIRISPSDFNKSFVLGTNLLSIEQYREVQRRVFISLDFKPVLLSRVSLKLLKSYGHTIKIITARNGDSLETAITFLKRENIYQYIDDIVGVGYGSSKVDACRGLDLYVDDDSKVIIDLLPVVRYLFMFRSNQNKDEVVPDSVTNINSWFSLFSKIKTLQ